MNWYIGDVSFRKIVQILGVLITQHPTEKLDKKHVLYECHLGKKKHPSACPVRCIAIAAIFTGGENTALPELKS